MNSNFLTIKLPEEIKRKDLLELSQYFGLDLQEVPPLLYDISLSPYVVRHNRVGDKYHLGTWDKSKKQ